MSQKLFFSIHSVSVGHSLSLHNCRAIVPCFKAGCPLREMVDYQWHFKLLTFNWFKMLFPLTSGLFGPRVLLCWEGHLWWAVLPLSALVQKRRPFLLPVRPAARRSSTTRRTSFIESLDHSGSAYPVWGTDIIEPWLKVLSENGCSHGHVWSTQAGIIFMQMTFDGVSSTAHTSYGVTVPKHLCAS